MVAPDGCQVFIDQEVTTGLLSASRGAVVPSVQASTNGLSVGCWGLRPMIDNSRSTNKNIYHANGGMHDRLCSVMRCGQLFSIARN